MVHCNNRSFAAAVKTLEGADVDMFGSTVKEARAASTEAKATIASEIFEEEENTRREHGRTILGDVTLADQSSITFE